MAIDIIKMLKKLRSGESVTCPLCGKGVIEPLYTEDYKTALVFECKGCGEKIWLNEKMPDS